MARYPTLPKNIGNKDLINLYKELQRWGVMLVNELDSRDLEAQNKPASNIFRVVSITSIGSPIKGDISYSASSGKFRGYVSVGAETSWQDLN